ncbi:MAG: MFS transporter, partial [Anaerolineae bacterium]
LILVYLVIFLITMSKGTINVIFPPFLEARAYIISQIGLLSSLFAVFQLAARLPAGVLYTPQRARLILSGGLLVLGTTALGFTAFEPVALLAAMIVLNGFAFGVITTVALALSIDAKPADYPSGAMMGWYTSAIAAGYAVGQPVGGFLADRYGFFAAFGGTAVFSLLAILIISSLPGLGQTASQAGTEPARRRGSRSRWGLRFDPRQIPSGVLLATLIVFFVNLMFRSLHTFFPLYALAVGLSLTQIGFLRSMLSLSAAAVRPFSGKLFQVIPYRRVTHLAMAAGAGAVVLSPAMTGSMALLVVLFVLMGLSRGLARVTSATMLAESSDRTEGHWVGVWSGVYNAGLDLGSIAGPAFGGYLASLLGIPRMLTVVPALALGTYAVVSLTARRKRLKAAATVAVD